MNIPTTVRAASGQAFSASILEVCYFGHARGFEAQIAYESVLGPGETWVKVGQLQPSLDWVSLASESQTSQVTG
jgi:hypothetical protein